LPPPLCARLIAECCAGLDFAHRLQDASGRPLNIVHRDLSANNIFVTYAGQVKVVDFGLATAADTGRFTQGGAVRGTFTYLAPEQVQAGPITRQADIWALGVNLYALLTGKLPFGGGSPAAVLVNIAEQPLEPPSRLRPNLPPALERIAVKALARPLQDRYPSAAQLRADLEAYLRDEEPTSGYDITKTMDRLFPPTERRHAQSIGSATQTVLTSPFPSSSRPSWIRRAALAFGGVLALGAAATVWKGRSPVATTNPQSLPAASASAERPRLTSPEAIAVGSLRITCNVPCEVEVDREPPRRAPFQWSDLSAGMHSIRAISISSKADRQAHVSVQAAETTNHNFVFENGRLAIRAFPWADVRVDGRPAGQTPLTPLMLLEGRHEVDLYNGELRARRHVGVVVHPGKLEELNIRLR
jgi:serine/threonine protein kinase